jgi:hypothetical protein
MSFTRGGRNLTADVSQSEGPRTTGVDGLLELKEDIIECWYDTIIRVYSLNQFYKNKVIIIIKKHINHLYTDRMLQI